MKILIVDDSRAMQTIVKRGIQQLGYDNIELATASNGVEALSLTRTWEPALIISDWHMPEMTGLELLTAISREMLDIKVGFVTTESSPEKLQKAKDAGAQFIVQKPFDTKTLHEAVLPIVQGSADGETTIQKHVEDKHNPDKSECAYDHIILPTLNTLTKKFNTLSTQAVTIKPTHAITLENAHYPYLLGLYGDKEKKSVHAITIADLESICIIGSMGGNVNEEDIHVALAERVIPKSIMDNCQATLKNIENLLHDEGRKDTLHLRSLNLMRKRNPNIEKLLDKKANNRLDVTLTAKGVGSGCLTFIVS